MKACRRSSDAANFTCMSLTTASTKALPVAAALLALPLIATSQAEAAPAGDSSITSAYQHWISTLEQSDCDGADMAKLYTKNGILLATFKTYVQGEADISKYFDGLSCLDTLTVSTQKLTAANTGTMGYATGLYTFSYKNDDGSTTKVPARFTFVFAKKQGKWLIANHHSSKDPETSKDPVAATP